MSFRFFLVFVFFFSLGFSQINLIPKPQSSEIGNGNFILNENTVIYADKDNFEAKYLQSEIKKRFDKNLQISKKVNTHSGLINLYINKNLRPENYELYSSQEGIIIHGKTSKEIFMGIQTLLQLFDVKNNALQVPFVKIKDFPKFQWRGMHLDVCRHFFTKKEVKKYIDYLAMYKINTFHWHLTDDQGWRIEIKKYPKLTEVGAWRNGSMIGHYSEQRFDDKKYGGFYTQEDIKEIVKYATDRHINVVPEIEMPGHAVAAIASYPWLSCTGKQIEVQKMWGVFDDIFCPKEETFTFLENVLTEVMELFPSKIIHIGGDEAPKTRWKNCAHCQALIKKEGLKDEHELQSYFIQRIEKFLNSKGRKIIGWDEILEGGLAPNAAVMSWRGTEGGIAAAKQKHDVVMSPGSHCYFDHYQGDPKNEPVAFGGYTTLEKVYQFNPLPTELTSDEQKYILGAQANLWTEYINDFNHVEYMLFPRIMALSEVLWGTSNPENYQEFQQRVFQNMKTLDKLGVNYSKSLFNVTSKSEPAKNGKDAVLISLKGFKGTENIYYTTDGTTPNINSKKYQNPFAINENAILKAAFFEDGTMKSKVMEQQVFVSKSTGKKITLKDLPDQKYFGIGAETLIDGLKGDPAKFGKDWLGFLGDCVATVDFEKETEISNLKINFVNANSSWIHLPKSVKIKFENGVTYEVKRQEIIAKNGIIDFNFPKTTTKKVTLDIQNAGIIPTGFDGAGNIAWLFVDEILLN